MKVIFAASDTLSRQCTLSPPTSCSRPTVLLNVLLNVLPAVLFDMRQAVILDMLLAVLLDVLLAVVLHVVYLDVHPNKKDSLMQMSHKGTVWESFIGYTFIRRIFFP